MGDKNILVDKEKLESLVVEINRKSKMASAMEMDCLQKKETHSKFHEIRHTRGLHVHEEGFILVDVNMLPFSKYIHARGCPQCGNIIYAHYLCLTCAGCQESIDAMNTSNKTEDGSYIKLMSGWLPSCVAWERVMKSCNCFQRT